jgi:hypothetical protein
MSSSPLVTQDPTPTQSPGPTAAPFTTIPTSSPRGATQPPYSTDPTRVPVALDDEEGLSALATSKDLVALQTQTDMLQKKRDELRASAENVFAGVVDDVQDSLKGVVSDLLGKDGRKSFREILQDKRRRRGIGYLLIAGATVGLLVEGLAKQT